MRPYRKHNIHNNQSSKQYKTGHGKSIDENRRKKEHTEGSQQTDTEINIMASVMRKGTI